MGAASKAVARVGFGRDRIDVLSLATRRDEMGLMRFGNALVLSGVAAVTLALWSGYQRWDHRGGPLVPVPQNATTSEHHMRARALRLHTPSCPSGVLPMGTTIVGVAQVVVSGGGEVLDVISVEPTSGSLAESLKEAGLASQFAPWVQPGAVPEIVTAHLTFYFQSDSNGCRTIDPFEVPLGSAPLLQR